MGVRRLLLAVLASATLAGCADMADEAQRPAWYHPLPEGQRTTPRHRVPDDGYADQLVRAGAAAALRRPVVALLPAR
ncbi:hypothetical protein M0638_10385 [Roseomonas sp. NAR14]|uniref:Uncharacterized protein n=1 Tax=Roseomonas acroporae TaxID=2937791 RepID=A0A9X1Y9G2_9PROT|nr:hypothetical protein [Roseomonas acroporae]MCK8784790.1 hypothetical protein [Roseomonas acroporae]